MQRFFMKDTMFMRSLTTSTAYYKPPLYYSLGQKISSAYTIRHQKTIQESKQRIIMSLGNNINKDLIIFIDTLFDFNKFSLLIQKIDLNIKNMVAKDYDFLHAYKKITEKTQPFEHYLQEVFLPFIRRLIQSAALHYQFYENIIESSDQILLEEDFTNLIEQEKLILDFAEDGHGPFPHIIAAFIMKELELAGDILSANQLYRSLAMPSIKYCASKANFFSRFNLILDSAEKHSMFANPASFSNHLLGNTNILKEISFVCKKHSHTIDRIAVELWKKNSEKIFLTKGKIRMLK